MALEIWWEITPGRNDLDRETGRIVLTIFWKFDPDDLPRTFYRMAHDEDTVYPHRIAGNIVLGLREAIDMAYRKGWEAGDQYRREHPMESAS